MSESSDRLTFAVTDADRGSRLDQVLVARVAGWSRSKLQGLIKDGRVRLAGKIVRKPGLLLMDAAEIEVDLAPAEDDASESGAIELDVLYADDDLVVVDKPSGLLSHRNARRSEASVVDLVRARFGELPISSAEAEVAKSATDTDESEPRSPDESEPRVRDEGDSRDRAGLVHRLDRETSGVMVLARTAEALADLRRQFKDRTVEKTYLALAHGDPRFDSDWIEKPLGRRENARDRVSVMAAGEGREAVTYFEVRERFAIARRAAGGPADHLALLAVFPKTGRTHQVRVHLSSIGLVLVGETLYLPRRRAAPVMPAGAPAIERQALHAHALAFDHPTTRERMRIESPLPEDFARVLEWLRRATPA